MDRYSDLILRTAATETWPSNFANLGTIGKWFGARELIVAQTSIRKKIN